VVELRPIGDEKAVSVNSQCLHILRP
jgi:hypothetical protein